MAVEIVRTATCNAPIEVAFDYVADYRQIPDWMFGIEKFEPVGEKDYGEGSVFDVVAKLGLPLRTRIRTVEFEENRVIGMAAVKGFDVRSRFTFADEGGGVTSVLAEVTLTLPGGIAGRAMGRAMAPAVSQAVEQANRKLVENVEARATAG